MNGDLLVLPDPVVPILCLLIIFGTPGRRQHEDIVRFTHGQAFSARACGLTDALLDLSLIVDGFLSVIHRGDGPIIETCGEACGH